MRLPLIRGDVPHPAPPLCFSKQRNKTRTNGFFNQNEICLKLRYGSLHNIYVRCVRDSNPWTPPWQGGMINQLHQHTIWRDKTNPYTGLQTHSSASFRTPRSNVSSQVPGLGWISGWFYLSQRICTSMKRPLLFREVSLFHTSLVNWHWISWFGLSIDPHRLLFYSFSGPSLWSPRVYTHQHRYW